MAHFAEIQNDIVTRVVVVNNEEIDGGEFPASEPLGQAFIAASGYGGSWLQCSYNANFRGVYPGIGWTYDATLDEFVAPPLPEETP